MEKYIKKPVVVDAFQYFYNNEKSTEELKNNVGMDNCFFDCDGKLFLRTLEGALKVRDGDYIIKGVKGEFYSCREDIFNLTYNTTKIEADTRYCVHLCKNSFYSFETFKSIEEAKSFGRDFFSKIADPNDLTECNCLFEVDDYVEAGKRIPPRDIVLQTQDSDYYQFKTDILAGLITYSTDKHLAANLETISAQRAQQIIAMNRRGEKPLSLLEDDKSKTPNKPKDLLEDDINRFDKAKHKKKKRPTGRNNKETDSPNNATPGAENERRPRQTNDNEAPRDNNQPRNNNNVRRNNRGNRNEQRQQNGEKRNESQRQPRQNEAQLKDNPEAKA